MAERARQALEDEPVFHGRSQLISFRCSEGRLVVEGRLPSYYLKQLLQSVLQQVEGVDEVVNRVIVDWPSNRQQT